ncbi:MULTISPECIES: hypothetical protein [unclassified Aliivibrio]|uniref:hypothetical protein n=1 Tax=unclassified Aliivibrio TaxID=2645654 RepID=UPI00080E76BD|nr:MULTISPECIES: hypothetical protein [unclassified Aliivibrio]OCH18813.1 hypothetical protein A6E05_00210 [Aliivibrio sp. 1S165]OCH19678.1 hypothetical protein A6E03_10125 [Aliivibrio sp. 1S128]OCH30993.1 hypothetical protein A6E06_05300 [Aliivibrio sp. 1S175]
MTPSKRVHSINIAVNVMRSRLTVIGFNIAVASFQINRLYGTSKGIDVAQQASPHISLLLAIALSMAAMVSYIYSSEYDQAGTCTSWHLIAGDLLMYCGLASTLSGFFIPIELILSVMAEEKQALSIHFSSLKNLMLFVGSISWFLATYIGPLHAISHSPFPKRTNMALAFGYFILLSSLGVITATAMAIDMNDATSISINQWLIEFLQPIRW